MTDQETLPPQTIIFDEDLGKRHPKKAFYLRITRADHNIDHVDLDDVHSLPRAVRMADELGYHPTHWMRVGDARPSTIPSGIVRSEPKAATPAPKSPSL